LSKPSATNAGVIASLRRRHDIGVFAPSQIEQLFAVMDG